MLALKLGIWCWEVMEWWRGCIWDILGGRFWGRNTASSIKKSISGLNGIVDSIGASGIVYFPEPKANLGHFVAAGELDSWGSHC
jgi:hypothetical protein